MYKACGGSSRWTNRRCTGDHKWENKNRDWYPEKKITMLTQEELVGEKPLLLRLKRDREDFAKGEKEG
jgi:hypothetical protein